MPDFIFTSVYAHPNHIFVIHSSLIYAIPLFRIRKDRRARAIEREGGRSSFVVGVVVIAVVVGCTFSPIRLTSTKRAAASEQDRDRPTDRPTVDNEQRRLTLGLFLFASVGSPELLAAMPVPLFSTRRERERCPLRRRFSFRLDGRRTLASLGEAGYCRWKDDVLLSRGRLASTVQGRTYWFLRDSVRPHAVTTETNECAYKSGAREKETQRVRGERWKNRT